MKVLFISLDDFSSFESKGTYVDFLRVFLKNKHEVFAVSPTSISSTELFIDENNGHIIKPFTMNSQKVGFIKKGLAIFDIPRKIMSSIKKCGLFKKNQFDLIIYATPPVTIAPVIAKLKHKNPLAKTLLLLKDIWPQVAIDVGILNKNGIKGMLTRIIGRYERKIYAVSEYIGCMSKANVDYLNAHYSLNAHVFECPNSMEPFPNSISHQQSVNYLSNKFNIDVANKIVLLYGGNLGIMQGIPFLIDCITATSSLDNIITIICGGGTEYSTIEKAICKNNIKNCILINGLPRNEFEKLVAASDYGLVFLNWKATTPNFPSRILPFMNASKPLIVCTDTATDLGTIACQNAFGYWVPSNDSAAYFNLIKSLLKDDSYEKMCDNSKSFFTKHYTSSTTYELIMKEIFGE